MISRPGFKPNRHQQLSNLSEALIVHDPKPIAYTGKRTIICVLVLHVDGWQQPPHPPGKCFGRYGPPYSLLQQRPGTGAADMAHLAAFELGMPVGKGELPLTTAGAGAQMDKIGRASCREGEEGLIGGRTID